MDTTAHTQDALATTASFLIADPVRRNERALEKRSKVLTFLRDEIWTSTQVVAKLLDVGYPAAHGVFKSLKREGLVSSSSFFVPSKRGACRLVLHGITSQGLAFAWRMDEVIEPRKPWEHSKINALFVPHQIDVQFARIRAELAGWGAWCPARLLMGKNLPKIPDAEAIDPDGLKVAIEVEREIKTGKRYEAVVGAYIAQMKRDGRWSRVDYLCPDKDFAARLARVFGQLHQLRLEMKGGQGTKVGDLQQAHLDRFRFYAATEWPSGKWLGATLNSKPTREDQ